VGEITPDQATAMLREMEYVVTHPEEVADIVFAKTELIHSRRIYSIGITPSSRNRSGRTLVGRGRLAGSVTMRGPEGVRRVEHNTLLFGTRVPYASIHQHGGVVIQSRTSAFGRPTRPYTWIGYYPQRKFLGFLEPDNAPIVNRAVADYVMFRVARLGSGGGANP